MTTTDLPLEWTEHYGAFMSFGEVTVIILGTCKECFATVNSDSFAAHTEWHLEQG